MSSLYQLTEDLLRLESLLLDSANDTGEVDQALADFLESTESDFTAKVDNYCALIRTLEERAKARRVEVARMTDLAHRDEIAVERLKGNLKAALERTGRLKVESDKFRVTVKKNGGQAPLEIFGVPSPEFIKTKTQPVYDRDAIREAIESGQTLDFARIGERGTRLEIK